MSISSESSAESARQMSEEPAPDKGPPRNIVTGVIKAIRPRQWVKNVLVFAAPVAALGDDRYAYDYREVLDQGAARVRGVQPGRVGRLPRQRRA